MAKYSKKRINRKYKKKNNQIAKYGDNRTNYVKKPYSNGFPLYRNLRVPIVEVGSSA